VVIKGHHVPQRSKIAPAAKDEFRSSDLETTCRASNGTWWSRPAGREMALSGSLRAEFQRLYTRVRGHVWWSGSRSQRSVTARFLGRSERACSGRRGRALNCDQGPNCYSESGNRDFFVCFVHFCSNLSPQVCTLGSGKLTVPIGGCSTSMSHACLREFKAYPARSKQILNRSKRRQRSDSFRLMSQPDDRPLR
jgi:hypothetical protein